MLVLPVRRGSYTLEEMGLLDPRERAPVVDGWDGIVPRPQEESPSFETSSSGGREAEFSLEGESPVTGIKVRGQGSVRFPARTGQIGWKRWTPPARRHAGRWSGFSTGAPTLAFPGA